MVVDFFPLHKELDSIRCRWLFAVCYRRNRERVRLRERENEKKRGRKCICADLLALLYDFINLTMVCAFPRFPARFFLNFFFHFKLINVKVTRANNTFFCQLNFRTVFVSETLFLFTLYGAPCATSLAVNYSETTWRMQQFGWLLFLSLPLSPYYRWPINFHMPKLLFFHFS